MATPKFRLSDTTETAPRRRRPRLTRDYDAPIASPVHALQGRLNGLSRAAAAPAPDYQAAAMRILLFVITPMTLWAGIFKLVSLL